MSTELQPIKPKGFWERPEGVTGGLFMAAIVLGGGYFLYKALPTLITLAENTLYLAGMLAALAAAVYIVLDPKVRNLVWYVYKSIMRWITGIFVQIDPIGILKSYIESLRDNLGSMNKQIGNLKGQMYKLGEMIKQNQRDIQNNLGLANRAKETGKDAIMVLKARKAGRLQESNMKLEDLYKRMEVLYRVLTKMYENSEIMLEDLQDQVTVKEQEYKAIKASHSAIRSAMNILSGNSDKKYMYDMALEAMADDVGQKVGEMERFMDVSKNFMDSIDLQNGVFEEEGLQMLDKWEKEGVSFLLGGEKNNIIAKANSPSDVLDLNANNPTPSKAERGGNQYDSFFDQ
ncbi:MAG: PspA/IM30 family protein [Bacteroidetes bacterium]|nr:PspA/IM30 family protein [Bacteroidota bacterium]